MILDKKPPFFLFWIPLVGFAVAFVLGDAQAQSLPAVFEEPFFSKFRLGVHYKQAEKLAAGGFREIGSIRIMTISKPSAPAYVKFIANRRTGKVTSITAVAKATVTAEQVIATMSNYTKSIQIEPGTLLDSTMTRHSDLPSVILCTSSNQYAVTYQLVNNNSFPPFTKIGVVNLAWLEEQLTEFRELEKKLGDVSRQDVRNVCK
jgi:predicted DNA-binding transcriptional regulator AlpA